MDFSTGVVETSNKWYIHLVEKKVSEIKKAHSMLGLMACSHEKHNSSWRLNVRFLRFSMNFTRNNMKPFSLVLGGGSARGIAHIGVIQRLEELNIRPSHIVGTSIGAIV